MVTVRFGEKQCEIVGFTAYGSSPPAAAACSTPAVSRISSSNKRSGAILCTGIYRWWLVEAPVGRHFLLGQKENFDF
ncbi:hypothetical protein L195_g012891 [Trifolium pratense]|uniref:Uncharacterized protein n=1 Tax=Trifolium pratense TaxID=57577 RepID=A0A2K3PLL5_TRIPR|nr:hypothetical protein L195_g012891 [Trifolium pratense]